MSDHVDTILAERGGTHGNYSDNARISQKLKQIFRSEVRYDRLNAEQHEAIDMIFHKIARIAAGNANFKDHWDDIAGYAKLVSERIVDAPKRDAQSTGSGSLRSDVGGRS